MERITSCTLDCPDCCSLIVRTGPKGIESIRGNPDHPITRGFTCAKIRRFPERLFRSDRITRPLIKKGGRWLSISWQEALDVCAEQIQEYRREPSSILHIQGDAVKGISPLIPKFFFASLGSSITRGCLCDSTGIAACIADFGSLESNDIRDLLNARGIVNWGKDLSRSSVHVGGLVKQARKGGAQVFTISPGGDGNPAFSDHFLTIRPGTDRFLATAVCRLILETGKIDPAILQRTSNWPAFKKIITSRPLAELAEACDVSMEEIKKLCRFYLDAKPVTTLIGWGLQRSLFGGENVRFINALALISGNVGKPGAGSIFNISSMRNFNTSWADPQPPGPLRALLLPAIGREILEAKNPPIEMIWVNNGNIVNQAPASKAIAEAFQRVRFKVVVDAFMTDTAERADLLLPCALMFEKEEMVGSFLHNFIHYALAILPPPGEAKSDYEILKELGARLHPPVPVPELQDCFSAALNSPRLETSLDDLKDRGFVEAKWPAIAFADLKFHHPDGKYRFVDSLHDEPPPPEDFPLRLLTLIRRSAIHSQIVPEDHESPARIRVSPKNPMLRSGLKEFYLTSPLGKMRVRVREDPTVHPDVVIGRRGSWMKLGGGFNQLIAPHLTDMGEGAAYYSQFVRLDPI